MTELPNPLEQALAGTDLLGGDSTAVSVKLSSVELADKTTLVLPSVGVTAVVGPNNAGKSTLLREIRNRLRSEVGTEPPWRIIQSIALEAQGAPADVVAWLTTHSRYRDLETSPGFTALGGGVALSPSWLRNQLPHVWSMGVASGRLGSQLAPFLVHYADTDTRLEQSKAAPARPDARGPAVHPIHVLQDDRTRLQLASEIAASVFGEHLWLDDYSSEPRLKVGAMSLPAPRRNEVDTAYRDALLGLPELAEQGDGMRSFFGLLLPMLAASHPLLLVDEPEAFLHPPQAGALGRRLGQLAKENGLQLILATHDRHLLTGLLESRADLTVVRVDRFRLPRGGRQIYPDALKDLWNEPALKYTNALDGLFHRLVVLVEGDRDARFYSACLDAANESGAVEILASEVLFVPCGGKGGMAKLARALRGLGVPVVASPDIDLLATEAETQLLVEALGGDWASLKHDFMTATSRILRDAAPLQVGDVRSALGDDPAQPLTKELRRTVERLLRTAGGGWAQVKAGGIAALGTGGIGAAAARLFDAMDAIGLVVVRAGELESFAPDLDVAKGANWVPAALTANAHKTPSAAAHVTRVVGVNSPR